jgi:phosphate-selective porin OprO/OprP
VEKIFMVLNNFIKAACLSTCLGLASGSALANEANYNVDTNGGLKVYDSSDNNHWFQLSGKMQLDHTLRHGEETSYNQNLRVLQADMKGGIGEDTSYSFRLSRGEDGTASLSRAQLSFAGFNSWSRVTVGQVKMPYGLDTGSAFGTNNALSNFQLDRNLGFNLDTWNDRMGLNLGLTQANNDSVTNFSNVNTSARLSFAPVNRDNLTVHFGLSGSYQSTRQSVSIDAAVLRGPALLQGEFHHSNTSNSGNENVANGQRMGWNLEASYALTGETRSYDYRNGSFGSLETDRDSGSWEVSVRHTQFNDGTNTDRTLGANVSWTVNNNVTLLANYENDMNTAPRTNGGNLSLSVKAAW